MQETNNGKGYIFPGTGATAIGSHQDTLSEQNTTGNPSPGNQSGASQYPASHPGISHINGQLYQYQQDRTFPTFPNAATLNTNSYLCLDGSNDIKVAKDEADIINGVINAALTQLKSGNEVGSYRITYSDTVPTNGGAGTWKDKGVWFIDKYYNDTGNVTYNYYLKTALTTVPGSDIIPLKLSSNDLKVHSSITDTSDLVQNVLLPTMTRRLSTGTHLCYEVVDETLPIPTGQQLRGTINNKRFTETSNTQNIEGSGESEVYQNISTPDVTGAIETVSTRYLKYLG